METDVVLETLLHHQIDLSLEREQLSRELDWILLQCLVSDNLFSPGFDVGLHLLNDELEGALDAAEDAEHQRELFKFTVLEHALTTCALLLHNVRSLLLNNLHLNGIHQGQLSLLLEIELSTLLFF